jgi:hypothetical protein
MADSILAKPGRTGPAFGDFPEEQSETRSSTIRKTCGIDFTGLPRGPARSAEQQSDGLATVSDVCPYLPFDEIAETHRYLEWEQDQKTRYVLDTRERR